MRIGILSSYGIMCGVAEYTGNLARALVALGHQVTIFGSYGGGRIRPECRHLLLPEEKSGCQAVRCFAPPVWSYGGSFDLPLIFREFERRRITGLIVQYQCLLYERGGLERLLFHCRRRGLKTVVTLHDSYLNLSLELAGKKVVTGKSLQRLFPGSLLIPQGVHELPGRPRRTAQEEYGLTGEVVVTLGLGRSDYRLIDRVARRLGWRFLLLDPTGSCPLEAPHVIRRAEWLSQEEMVRILQACRVVILWYPPVQALVTSSSAPLAAASRRPVVVNDTAWFADLPEGVFYKVRDEEELVATLVRDLDADQERRQRQDAYIQANSWNQTARRYLSLLGA